MSEVGIPLDRTILLNDWLNTIATYSIFGEYETTEDFAEIIDGILEAFEEELSFKRIEKMRLSGNYSDETVDAILDLYELLIADAELPELRLPSPKNQNRYWLFYKNEYQVIQITSYEFYGLEVIHYQQVTGTLDALELDYIPDEIRNYDLIEAIQTDLLDEEVMTPEEWEAMRDEDMQTQYLLEASERPDYNHLENQCFDMLKKYPDSKAGLKCQKIKGHYRNVMAHMIAWPIALFVLILLMICIKSYKKARVARNAEEPMKSKPEDTDLPPTYNFIIQFPPEYADAIKTEKVETTNGDPIKTH